jgi:hypothetical protein
MYVCNLIKLKLSEIQRRPSRHCTDDAGGISSLNCNADALREKAASSSVTPLRQPTSTRRLRFPQITYYTDNICFSQAFIADIFWAVIN